MNRHGLRIIAIAVLTLSPAVAGCAKETWTPALAGAVPPRSSIVAEADVPASTQPPTTQARVTSATAVKALVTPPVTPVAPTPAPERIGLPPVREYEAIPELQDIHFDSGKAVIRPVDAKILDANAAWLRANPNQLLLIEGHSDARGQVRSRNEWNMALGEERAQAAMNYLIAHGVQSSRITILSYGEERPVCTDQSERCWSQNRRSRFLVKPR